MLDPFVLAAGTPVALGVGATILERAAVEAVAGRLK